jgi:AmmeMemoRadiSam system protein B
MTRAQYLGPGWYPSTAQGIEEFIGDCGFTEDSSHAALGGIAPHAGWFFSGRLAAQTFACLDPGAEVVIISGGHRGASTVPLLAMEDAFETPLGAMPAAAGLRAELSASMHFSPDQGMDNSVEVLVPLARHYFPQAELLWMRLPNDLSSLETGKLVARCADKLKKRVVFVASTDLTHYGRAYGFTPKGRGPEALEWMRSVNDRRFIESSLAMDGPELVKRAEAEGSACSVGGVAGLIGFATARGLKAPKLLGYGTSLDADPGRDPAEAVDQCVGYCSIAYY